MTTPPQANVQQTTPGIQPPQLARQPSWHEKVVMSILAVPQRQWPVLADTDTFATLEYQAKSLVVSSVSFGASAFLFNKLIIGNGLGWSALAGGVAGAMLYQVDKKTVVDLRNNPALGRGSVVVVRIGTVLMALTMAVLMGVFSHQDDIARIQESNAKVTAERMEKSPEYATRLSTQSNALKQAENEVQRLAKLDIDITKAKTELAEAEAELKRELDGAMDPKTGYKRIAERGPRARHWEATANALSAQKAALESERSRLRDPVTRKAEADQKLTALRAEMAEKAQVHERGAARKIQLLFQLLAAEWAAWLTLGFAACIALLPEAMLLRAMIKSKDLLDFNKLISPIEQARQQAIGLKLAAQEKLAIAAGSRPTVVRITTPVKNRLPSQSANDPGIVATDKQDLAA